MVVMNMVKYIGNGFSMGMIENEDVLISIKTITKNQFIKAGNHAKSIIGHPEIAKIFDLPLNRESITLKKGDILYIVSPTTRPMANQMVENGAKYTFIPEEEGYTYKQIQVLDK